MLVRSMGAGGDQGWGHPVRRDAAGSTRHKKFLCSGVCISTSLLSPKCKHIEETSSCGVLPHSSPLMALELVRGSIRIIKN